MCWGPISLGNMSKAPPLLCFSLATFYKVLSPSSLFSFTGFSPKLDSEQATASSTIKAQTNRFLPWTPRLPLVRMPQSSTNCFHSIALSLSLFPPSMATQGSALHRTGASPSGGHRGGGQPIRGCPNLQGPCSFTAQPESRPSVGPEDFRPDRPQGGKLAPAPASPLTGVGEYVCVPGTDTAPTDCPRWVIFGVRELFLFLFFTFFLS